MPRKIRDFIHRHLSPGDRLAEALCGLIMVLSFTLAAGLTVADGEDAVLKLLIAAVGCNVAWGIIDGILYIMSGISQRGEKARLIQALQSIPDPGAALDLIRGKVKPNFESLAGPEACEIMSQSILKHLAYGKATTTKAVKVTKDDLQGALAVCLLEILTCLPAAVPFLIFDSKPVFALRVSNFLLVGMLFIVGHKWAQYVHINRLLAGLVMASIGLALVGVATLLGG